MISILNNSLMIKETKKAKRLFNPYINMVIAVVLLIVPELILVFPSRYIFIFLRGFLSNNVQINNLVSLINLFVTIGPFIICPLFCRYIEKRSLTSMGIIRNGFLKQYVNGLLLGFIMFSGVVLLILFSGEGRCIGIAPSLNPIIMLFFIGYLIQGASEELICRGFLSNSIAAKKGVTFAIIANSVFFSLLHIKNDGFTILAFINIVLVGLFFSIYAYKHDNIIGVCAIHSIWNFAQGNIYGISVSGTNLSPSILQITPINNSIFFGGAFGAESGLACTIIMIISLIFILVIPQKQ